MKKLLLASAIFTTVFISSPNVFANTIPVTMDNYNQAIAAKYMGNWDKRGADKAIVHIPILVPAGDKAPVVRMNQDSLYSSAIVRALLAGAAEAEPIRPAKSVADSLTVEMPRNAIACLAEIRASEGGGVTVSDDAILASIARLASATGVFAEPAGAAVLAGLEAALEQGLVTREERVVLMVTGSGLKDVVAAASALPPPAPVEASLDGVSRAVAEHR